MSNTTRIAARAPEAAKEKSPSVCKKTVQATSGPSNRILFLQTMMGNIATQKLIQAKLSISEPGDIYEREADRVAEQVMRVPSPAILGRTEPPQIQRVCAECEEELKAKTGGAGIQRMCSECSGELSTDVEAQIGSMRGSGQPLPQSTRAFFEPRFRHDFRDVRLHTSAQAAQSARAVNALAFTMGRDIVFGSGQYAPEKESGRRVLAHELTHVIQQSGYQDLVQRFSTQDCDPPDMSRLDESHKQAIAMLKKAIDRLTASPVTPETQTHFSNHFGAYAGWRRSIVVWHLRRDLNLLTASEMTYECETECDPGEPAYTYWIFGDIHICLPWLRSQVLTERGETFIHELHHWDPLRGHLDLGYHKNNVDNKTTWIVAVNNADAYSEMVQDLYEQP